MSNITIEFMGHEVPVTIHSYSSGYPAVMNPPDKAMPEEFEEAEWEVVTGNELLDTLLNENHSDDIELLVFEAIHNEQENAAEEYAEAKFEAERDRDYGY